MVIGSPNAHINISRADGPVEDFGAFYTLRVVVSTDPTLSLNMNTRG